MADLLQLIGTILQDRQQKSQQAQQGSQFDRSLAQSSGEFDKTQQFQREKFAEELKENTRRYGLDERQVDNQVNQFAARLATEKEQFDKSFGLQEGRQNNTDLAQFSEMVGRGANNSAQADILSMLGGKLGLNLNSAQLLNAGQAAGGGVAASPGMWRLGSRAGAMPPGDGTWARRSPTSAWESAY